MYIILNFGMSPQFGDPDFEHLVLPAIMKIDYVRVYQRTGMTNIGVNIRAGLYLRTFLSRWLLSLTRRSLQLPQCDPPGYPTMDYIDR